MRAYHLMSERWGLEAIRRKRLKAARFSDLNDPFELLAADLTDRHQRSAFRRWKDEINERYGVLCFSANWRSSLLWSHYGDKHHGLCLGFDLPDEKVVRVRYQRSRMTVSAGSLEEATVMRLLSTKSHEWQYEQETRIVVQLDEPDPQNGHFFVDFGIEGKDLALREVVIGSLSSLTRRQLDDELENAGLPSASFEITKARLAFRSYSIVRDRRGLT